MGRDGGALGAGGIGAGGCFDLTWRSNGAVFLGVGAERASTALPGRAGLIRCNCSAYAIEPFKTSTKAGTQSRRHERQRMLFVIILLNEVLELLDGPGTHDLKPYFGELFEPAQFLVDLHHVVH